MDQEWRKARHLACGGSADHAVMPVNVASANPTLAYAAERSDEHVEVHGTPDLPARKRGQTDDGGG